jgi:hypothetical protein
MTIKHNELGYHDYKNDIVERGFPDWLVRDSAAFEKMKVSGVDNHASSYTAGFEKSTVKKPENFKDHLVNKECTRPGLKYLFRGLLRLYTPRVGIKYSLYFPLLCDSFKPPRAVCGAHWRLVKEESVSGLLGL